MKCFHSPDDPWAYNKHRRRDSKPCPAALKAWAKWVREYRAATGITKNRLVPIKRNTK